MNILFGGINIGMAILFEQLATRILKESNFDIDEDVEFLLGALGIKDSIELYKKSPIESFFGKVKNAYTASEMEPLTTVSSMDLPSDIAIHASNKKLIKIEFITNNGSHQYISTRNRIEYSIPFYIIKELGERGLENKRVMDENPEYLQYFELNYWRGIIAHELTHWLEDALYGKVWKAGVEHTKKTVKTTKKMNSRLGDKEWVSKHSDKLDQIDLYRAITSPEETEALIAQLSQHYKHTDQKEWDAMTFKDLYKVDRTFAHYINKARNGQKSHSRFQPDKKGLSPEEFQQYIQFIIRKMNRVGILGRNMRNPEGDIM